ncbi:hypothetical protein [Phenylobacterium sp. J367]|uniref:hypothetical protein n=1 Tax=Phenylobacterium sp. J367 TaxID=2898435 RepID=UPI0021511C58|nr:hypothetical protein [Phenylobacterium sp. J367]MCR5877736.1 hypothetical protein [Phenylobacterium sp. J367]
MTVRQSRTLSQIDTPPNAIIVTGVSHPGITPNSARRLASRTANAPPAMLAANVMMKGQGALVMGAIACPA